MKIPRRRGLAAVLGLVSVVALATAWLAYERDLRRERARVASGSQIAVTRCGPIEFASIGRGPAVLLVHGAGGGFDQALDIATELAAQGFRTISMSRFGYLRTPLPADASPAAQADAHACLLDTLGIERAAIVGVSAGAPSSMQFALRHPQRTNALALLVPLAYAPREGKPEPEMAPATRFMLERAVRSDLLYWAALKAAPSLVVKTVLATPPEVLASASAQEQARARAVMQNLLPLSDRRQGLLNDWAIGAAIVRYPLERITAPTLVVSLKDDLYGTFRSARYTAAHIPGARFVGYASGGHAWVGHHGEIFAQLVGCLGGGALPPADRRDGDAAR
jgi:pimeloyl-ACP methyl ester carboxylesterase